MTQTEKDLLLKDLCARLPYGVKVKLGDNQNIFDLEYIIKFNVMYGDSYKLEDILNITNIKPYLFPLSSMTEEQKKEWCSMVGEIEEHGHNVKLLDWLNKNHIDYRGLIQLGLAIDATGKGIYQFNF